METHSRVLAWGIPQTEDPGGDTVMVLQKSPLTGLTNIFTPCSWIRRCNVIITSSQSGQYIQ